MFTKNYSNFVKPGASGEVSDKKNTFLGLALSGEEARKMYINEVKHVKDPDISDNNDFDKITKPSRRGNTQTINTEISDKDLLLSVQNDDIQILMSALDSHPDKINKLDDYGWSLLMIACQANSIESVKELLRRGCNTAIRDKAGNSAQSLVIMNKNYILADLLLSNIQKEKEIKTKRHKLPSKDTDKIEDFFCDMCNIKVKNKEYHLSSTIHNINLSKGKKIPTNYKIPETNRGYQIMLKVGWDRDTGLGPDGTGKKYPIKTIQKKDRKGLGHEKKTLKVESQTETVKHTNKNIVAREHESNRKMEIDFRRQFY